MKRCATKTPVYYNSSTTAVRMSQMEERSGRVLIVEDHVPTSRLMATAFHEMEGDITCVEVRTAEKAIEFLTRTGAPSEAAEIVLLDLDLPDDDGFAVLETLRDDPELCRKPVIVVSSTPSQEAINRCYELHARTFIPKPDDWDEFTGTARAIADYWFGFAACPTTTPFTATGLDNPPIQAE